MKNKKSESIRTQLLGPLLVLLVLQAAVIAGTVLFGGVSAKLKSNEIQRLIKNTEDTKLGLEKETIYHWIRMLNNSDFMSEKIEFILDKNKSSPEDIFTDYNLNQQIQDEIMEKSLEMLHLSDATGTFLILNGPTARNSPAGMKAGFYIRNSNLESYTKDNSSFLMERGLPSLAEKYNIPLDSFWEIGFYNNASSRNLEFFYKPYEAAVKAHAPMKDQMEYAYLSPPFRLSRKDIPIITYSVPIILKDGTEVGVFGLEISLNQLEKIITEEQINGSFEECWVLGIREKGTNRIVPVSSAGNIYHQYFSENEILNYEDSNSEGVSSLTSDDGTKWYASIEKIDVYKNGSPYEKDEWVLAGISRQSDLLDFYNVIRRMLLSSMLVPLIFSLLGAYVIGRIITEPIRRLIRELREKSGSSNLILERVHVREIDELTETIEQLNRDVERASSKISSILEYANVFVGVFEYEKDAGQVFCSRSLLDILDWRKIEETYCYIGADEFHAFMKSVFPDIQIKAEHSLRKLETEDGIKWVELIIDDSKAGIVLGVCIDVTADVKEKEKLERERNMDLLTELYNRRAFKEKVQGRIKREKVRLAAAIMWDLDNLKYINDTYGHDEGDRYLSLFADCLKQFINYGGVVSRYSGDEFVVFLEGSDKEEIRNKIREFMKYIKKFSLSMVGGYQFPIRVSGGLAWFPDDAGDYDLLYHYADFAMYMVKHSVKGVVKEFDSNEFSHNSYMLAGSEELNRMLDKKEVRFAFQPIATRDGSLYGYELLMRPDFLNITGIGEVLNLARAQAKLPQMEVLTWFAGLKAARAEADAGQLGKDEKLFINSIASVCLTEEGQRELEELYGDLLSRIVIEMTEGEPTSQNFIRCKTDMAKKWGGQTAVDDFGTGYNSEAVLLHMNPDIVKMDRSLISRIHKDQNRQIILKNLLDFAAQNQIRVLAEGVETAEELEFLIHCGVSLFQGYYIARPQMEIRPLNPYIVKKMQEFSGKT